MPFAFGVLWKMNGFVLVDISGKEVVQMCIRDSAGTDPAADQLYNSQKQRGNR